MLNWRKSAKTIENKQKRAHKKLGTQTFIFFLFYVFDRTVNQLNKYKQKSNACDSLRQNDFNLLIPKNGKERSDSDDGDDEEEVEWKKKNSRIDRFK